MRVEIGNVGRDGSDRGGAAPDDVEVLDTRHLVPIERLRRSRTSRREMGARAVTINTAQPAAVSKLSAAEVAELERLRPRTRGDCVDGPRPCPWVGCRHHLYLDAFTNGSIKINFPDREPWDLVESCSLDVAARGGQTLDEVSAEMDLTREGVRQIEVRALLVIRMASPSPDEVGLHLLKPPPAEPPAPRREGRGRRIDPETHAAIRAELADFPTRSDGEIAGHHDVSPSPVARLRRLMGIDPLPSKKRAIDVDAIRAAIRANPELTDRVFAERFKVSPSAIGRQRALVGVEPTRPNMRAVTR